MIEPDTPIYKKLDGEAKLFLHDYEVSNTGIVWRVKPDRMPKVLSQFYDAHGHACVALCLKSRRYTQWWVHNLVTEAFIGPKPDGATVIHGERGKQCNHIDNLSYLLSPTHNCAGI